ncbi:hypothetical protein C358_02737 [Cryptococcus neoformans MW-RSA852]|nr:hypothetical protein C358_02737 [Cryptococcus neoformans var. grubii MW-RSA852]
MTVSLRPGSLDATRFKSLRPEQAWMRFELVEAQEHPELVRYRYWYAHRDSSQEAVKKAKAWAAEYGKKPMIH